jgi:hypothetical protein
VIEDNCTAASGLVTARSGVHPVTAPTSMLHNCISKTIENEITQVTLGVRQFRYPLSS